MKRTIIKKLFAYTLITITITFCTDPLKPSVNSELSTQALKNKDAVNSVLGSAYSNAQFFANGFPDPQVGYQFSSLLSSGLAWERKGGVNADLQPLIDFNWTSSNRFITGLWNGLYKAIRDANIVLANIDQEQFNTDFKSEVTAEAKFLRGWAYYQLFLKFGSTPLHKSPEDDPKLARASESEMKSFIEQQLADAASSLPADQDDYGRATKGAALGLLCKYYLNTKQWQKSADVAKQIMDMNKYGLLSNYKDIFALENEGNKELIWVINYNGLSGNNINPLTFPKNYPLPYSNIRSYAAETFLYDSFVNSFDTNDTRKDLIDTDYTLTDGTQVNGLGNDQSLPLKYPFDPNGSGGSQGDDIPVVRYADILLSRAEALNEMNGPNPESINLLNQIRARAGVSQVDISSFNKSSLREEIFTEREKEFFYEFHEREDKIRHGTFVSDAQDRGLNADEHQKLFPIPQTEIDANPNIEQNPGY